MFKQYKQYKQYKQHDERDCGAACLATILSYYGRNISLVTARKDVFTNSQGTNIYGIVQGAKKFGLDADAYNGTLSELVKAVENKELRLPVVAHIIRDNMLHFVVISAISGKSVSIFDPALGNKKYLFEEFEKYFSGNIIAFECTQDFKKGNDNKNCYKEYFRLITSEKKGLISAILFSMMIICLGLFCSLLYQRVLDAELETDEHVHLENESAKEEEVSEEDNHKILSFIDDKLWKITDKFENSMDSLPYSSIFKVVISAYFFICFLTILRTVIIARVARKIDNKIMIRFLNKLHKLPVSYYQNINTGEILTRFQDVSSVRDLLSYAGLTIIFDIFLVIGGMIMMFAVSYVLSALAMIIAIIYALLFLAFKNIVARLNNLMMENEAKIISKFKEYIDGMLTFKLFGSNKIMRPELEKNIYRYSSIKYNGDIVFSIQASMAAFVKSAGTVFILWVGISIVSIGKLSVGYLMTFIILIEYIFEPISDLIEMQHDIQKSVVAVQRMNDVLEQEEEKINTVKSIGFENSIYVKNANFRYFNNNLVLENYSIEIGENEKVAIMGNSGCGKSSIAKILLGLYPVESGIIKYGSFNINDISLQILRRNVLYVDQQSYLFSGSIRDNITLGEEISDELIKQVSYEYNLNQKIFPLSDLLDNYVDENGANYSGGQKQLIALARALVRNPKVLILDEATNQLDEMAENSILEAIAEKKEFTTCLFITHHTLSVSKIDRIIRM